MGHISALQCPVFISSQPNIPRGSRPSTVMVRTRGGSRLRPRVRFSTSEREAPAPVLAPVPSPVPEAVSEEPQGFRRYQTRMGPRAPSPVPQRRARRARPSKRARTSGLGESSSTRPQPSPVTSAAEATSSSQLSPASRIRRPLFVGNPIPGNVRLHRREFHQESYYDVPALRADPRFRDSMRLIEDYSLLPFMTPRQYYYPRVVLQFYHSMTSQGATGPLELQFSIDDRPGVLRAADISAALGLVRADSLPLLMPRLLCQVLEHMGFPEEPRLELRARCPLVLSMERVMAMPISFILQPQDQEEVPAPEPEDSRRDAGRAPEIEVERTPIPDRSPPSPPHTTSAAAPTDTPGPSYSAHHSPEYVHSSSREIAGVMDAICSLAATQAAQDQRLAQCHSMLQQIMTHLGLPHAPVQRDEPTTAASASLDVLAAAAVASDPPPPQQ